MTDFKDFYSIDALLAYRVANDSYRIDQDDKSPEQDARVNAWLDQLDIFEAAIGSFLEAKRGAGELSHIAFIDERKLKWGDQWTRFIDKVPGCWDSMQTLCEGMGLLPMTLLTGKRKDADAGTTLEASYADLLADVNDGADIIPQSAYGSCDRTGTTYCVQMQSGWKPHYGTFDDNHDFVPLTQGVDGLKVQHQTIPVPSGELLINDWFRIDAFNEAIKLADGISVSHLSGIWAASEHYGKLGFASVLVGNTCPSIVQNGGQLLIGNGAQNENDDKLEGEIGSVCTDRWWATLIDREVLTAIVAKTAGREDAEKQVAALLKEYAHTITTVRLPPGSELHIYHCEPDGLKKSFKSDAVDMSAFDAFYLVASPTELEWNPVKAAKKKKMSR